MASIRDPREKMANQLLMRGHASVAELLEASYGEWPPKGLDIEAANDQRVQLVSVFQMKQKHAAENGFFKQIYEQVMGVLTVAGLGTVVGDRQIGTNKMVCCVLPRIFGRSMLNETMGHEMVHVLQGDHYWRAKETLGHDASQKIWTNQNDTASNMIANDVFSKHQGKGFLQRAFVAATGLVMNNIDYLKSGLEIQARIHEALVDGYPRWGALPATKEEFLVAMQDSGLNIPESVRARLDASPGIEAAREKFDTFKFLNPSAAGDLNQVQRALTEEGREMFWEETLPALYGDLIEMYGDGPGRERLGLGVNEKRIFREDLARSAAAPAQPVA